MGALRVHARWICGISALSYLVRERGLEPPHLAATAPQTVVSTIPPLALIQSEMVGDEGLEPPTLSV